MRACTSSYYAAGYQQQLSASATTSSYQLLCGHVPATMRACTSYYAGMYQQLLCGWLPAAAISTSSYHQQLPATMRACTSYYAGMYQLLCGHVPAHLLVRMRKAGYTPTCTLSCRYYIRAELSVRRRAKNSALKDWLYRFGHQGNVPINTIYGYR